MPSGFNIGPIEIQFYGIFMMLGVLAEAFLAQHQANRRGQNGKLVCDMLIWILIAGVIGARIWHILTPSPSLVAQGVTALYYLTHQPKEITLDGL